MAIKLTVVKLTNGTQTWKPFTTENKNLLLYQTQKNSLSLLPALLFLQEEGALEKLNY